MLNKSALLAGAVLVIAASAGAGHAADPTGSTPSAPRPPAPSAPSVIPMLDHGPTGLAVRPFIPPQPPTGQPQDERAADDEMVDAIVGLILLQPAKPTDPSELAADNRPGPQLATHTETCDPDNDNDYFDCWDLKSDCAENDGGMSTNPDGTETCTWED